MTSSDSEMMTTMQGSATAVPVGKPRPSSISTTGTHAKEHSSPSSSPPTPDTSIDMSMDESRDETTSLNLTNSSFGMVSLNSSTSSEEDSDDEDLSESSDDESQSSTTFTSHEQMLTHQITEDDDLEEEEEEQGGKNHAIKSIEEALEIQKRNFGEKHPTIAKTLHSLALEYRSHQQYDRAMMHLREALDILEDKLESIRNRVEMSSQSSHGNGHGHGHGQSISMTRSMSTITTTSTSMNETNSTLEQKSALCACLANIYKLRQCYKEAMEYYLQSINLLVEANHPGDSPRISMLMRIMKRTEAARKQSQGSQSQGQNQGQMR